MQIYFVYDGWDETSVFEIQFYVNKADAEAEVERRIAKLHEEKDAEYERKLDQWKTRHDAKMAVVAAGLPIPSELSWLTKPEKKTVINHGITVDYVEVQE